MARKRKARSQRKIGPGDLGIRLGSEKEEELFKWLLACLLFGKPIQAEVAARAYRSLAAKGLVSPQAILRAGWDELVRILDEAHYVRYDFSTATKLLEISQELRERYGGVKELIAQAETPRALSAKLQEIKHVGPVTARIFLRGIRPICYRSRASSRRNRGARVRARRPRRGG
jgi:endonuclease III